MQKTAKVPQLARSFQVADVPGVQVQVPQVLCGCENVPVIIQPTSFVSFDVEVPQIQFTRQSRGHSRCATETGTRRYGGGDGAFF